MSKIEEQVLSEVQRINIVEQPFLEAARRLDMNEDDIIEITKNLLDKHYIRRFSASLSHRRLGIGANAMVVLNCPEDRIDEVGNKVASFSDVTHCYFRTGWDYNIFFMVHGYSKTESTGKAKKIIDSAGIDDYKILFSEREFKKTSLSVL